MCTELAQLLRADAEAQGVSIRVDAPRAVPLAADPGQLRRALLNLAQNAVQASPKGSEVVLGARREGGEVALTVSDHGGGIAPATLEKIWTPFYTTKQKGTGLGLAFVREIAVDHGGRVDVESTSAGTTFTLRLPA